MQENTRKTIWRRIGLILVLLPVCFVFPFALILVGFVAWTIYEDLKPQQYPNAPPPRTWRDARPEDSDWLDLFCAGCESPAEERFLREMVKEYKLKPRDGKLISPNLTLEIQFKFSNYRFDFLANGCQIIEIDGATYHSSPEQVERDKIRDQFSLQNGYKVLRIPASIVFNSPDEAVRRAKAVICSTPAYTKPHKDNSATQRKTISQHINSLSRGIDEFNRKVDVMKLKQVTLADFRSAISTEKIFLDSLIKQAELDQKIYSMPAETRKTYQELLATMGPEDEDRIPLAEIYKWEKISKPDVIDDSEAQFQIETEYLSAMKERSKRIFDIKLRCQNDSEFARFFSRKMIEAKYPMEDVINIIPMPRLLEYTKPTT